MAQPQGAGMSASPFLNHVREIIRLQHLSPRTEDSYLYYLKDFILFQQKRHPNDMGVPEIRAYLSDLAIEGNVSASPQRVAFSALLFLYRDVLKTDLPKIDGIERTRASNHLPVVFTCDEVKAILSYLRATPHLVASLLYGSGMRLMEGLRLRVKDADFTYRQITVHDGKGLKDHVTVLPQSLIEPLKRQLETAKRIHAQDLREGYGAVYLPYALERKYPNVNRAWGWQ